VISLRRVFGEQQDRGYDNRFGCNWGNNCRARLGHSASLLFSEGSALRRVWEPVGAIIATVRNVESVAFEATFMVVQKLAFDIHEFGNGFCSGICSGGCCRPCGRMISCALRGRGHEHVAVIVVQEACSFLGHISDMFQLSIVKNFHPFEPLLKWQVIQLLFDHLVTKCGVHTGGQFTVHQRVASSR